MTLPGSVRTCLTKYAVFSGRATRPEYWWFFLFVIVGALIAAGLDRALFEQPGGHYLKLLFQLATLLPFLAVGWRRMQDTGRPGWLIFLPIIVSVTFIFMSTVGFMSGPAPNFQTDAGQNRFIILGVLQLVAFIVMLKWLAQPGDDGKNPYGPAPAGGGP